ncbi:hypothetical protein [Streptomyces kasugaensis]|uniref:hypothetical protein n=1 Tax=Streptomyces kasugaensis TaxID=1946 RepID=UPI001A94489B|nr:hypothetical protein [Streptomyces kasugaensis]
MKNSVSAMFLIGATALAVTACSGGPQPGDAAATNSPSAPAGKDASPTASADPQAAAKKEVLATYSRFWTEQVKAYAQASDKGTDLEKYATTEALSRALGDLQSLRAADKTLHGTPTHDAKVTALGMDKKIPNATITDCLDVSSWKTVTAAGKEVPSPEGVLKRYVTAVSAEKWGNTWMITKVDQQRRSC